MFDRLAGTGAAGRRMLTEAEEHLHEAAAEGRARGLDPETAEQEAVDRFGEADTIAYRLRIDNSVTRIALRRVTLVAWAVAGAAMAWFGLSGGLTYLLSEPWTKLLIATDRFGAHPMCEPPWFTPDIGPCAGVYRMDVSLLPGVDNGFPYAVTGAIGAVLTIALLILRRTTVLGTPSWTPSRRVVRLVLGLSFGLIGVGLVVEAIDGIFKDVQYYVLADFVAGLLAIIVAAVALGWRSPPGRRHFDAVR
ncbi:permease prefix domain 1-containing protein [Actinoplanes sp. NPDC049596]|uniref:permease prefix domain 1-containing protein n=1 Tax=unclassified Actinoplanes TaxID=2626549 RepID=UPI003444565B